VAKSSTIVTDYQSETSFRSVPSYSLNSKTSIVVRLQEQLEEERQRRKQLEKEVNALIQISSELVNNLPIKEPSVHSSSIK